jgi:D-glycero-D-manno-heptose 1,7-bisphosphate phosphatase
MQFPQIDTSWTLFLDRDGVINKKIDHDYVRSWSMFEFLPGAKESLKLLASTFGKIIIVTNQRGIGRGLMTVQDLDYIHTNMVTEIVNAGGRIDAIYFCSDIDDEGSSHRKPKPGMALDAQKAFPEISFAKSVMVGDSESDILFGKNLAMLTVSISRNTHTTADYNFQSLADFSALLLNIK